MSSSALLKLPTELLTQILEEVGGRDLRRDVSLLLISQRWYHVAKPVYLSGIEVTQVHIFGHNLKDLDDGNALGYSGTGAGGARALMLRNTRRLRIRILGHWWDENTAHAIRKEDEQADGGDRGTGDTDARQRRSSDRDDNDADADDMQDPELIRNQPLVLFTEPSGKAELEQWRVQELRPRLETFFSDLPHFSALENITFEATCDPIDEDGPRWPYLSRSTAERFLNNLPLCHNLQILTLDLTTGNLLPDDAATADEGLSRRTPAYGHHAPHLCSEVARVIPYVPHVRLRMSRICNAVFQGLDEYFVAQGGGELSPAATVAGVVDRIKIRTLALKLNVPMFEFAVASARGAAHPCAEMPQVPDNTRMLGRMYRASLTFMRKLRRLRTGGLERPEDNAAEATDDEHGLQGLRITYTTPGFPNILTLDCLTSMRMFFGEEMFAFEDDGTPDWFEFGPRAAQMLNGGRYTFQSR